MSSTNDTTREGLVRKMQELAAAMQAEQDERIANVQLLVDQLASEGVKIKLLLETRKPSASKMVQVGGKRPAKWKHTYGDETWSGQGQKPKWFKDGHYEHLGGEQWVASAE